MPKSFEQPPIEALAELQELTKRRRELVERAATGATTPEEAEQALKEAEEMVPELESRRSAIREKLWPFAELSKERVEQCYQNQVSAFEQAGVFEAGTHTIKGIDDRVYPMLTLAEVTERLRAKKEIVEQKVAQGLTRVQLRPIAMPMDTLRERYTARIREHYVDMLDPNDPNKRIPDPTRTKLFAAKENPTDPDEPLALDTNQPLYTRNEYEGADVNGTIVYFPKHFDPQNHEGKTKQEVITEVGGWQIILTEDNPNLAADGQGETKGGRKQLEAGKSSNEYLQLLATDPMYMYEEGFITEDWLTYAIIQLETTNQVLDDWQGKGKISRNVGQYFPASGYVPGAYWDRDYRQASLFMADADNRVDSIGVRSAVRV